MEYVKAERLSLNNGSKDLIKEGSFRILEGGKYGLVGPNGSGKTSLIRLLTGDLEPDSGRLQIMPGLRIGYMPQQPDYVPEQSIEDFLISDLAVLMDEMNAAAEKMSSESSGNTDRQLAEYQSCCERFEQAGGYSALEKAESVLRRLGLDNPLDQEMGTLSGGERSLVFFTAALLSGPELLILDEPGNHLDYLGLAWLEKFLAGFQGAVLVVSHNRYLLDKTCSHIWGLENGSLTVSKGNYSDYKLVKYRDALIEQSEWEASRKRCEKLEKKIKELQSIAMSQYNPPASVMAQLGDAKKKLAEEQARNLERPEIGAGQIKPDFGDEKSRSNIALRIKDFSLAFGDRQLFSDAELEIGCGQKVALVGPNGSGKSSLIKAVINYGQWESRTLRIGPSQKIGYLSQTAVFSEGAVTIEDEVRSWGPLSRDGAFSIINRFSFGYEDLKKELSVLSGGESNRLQLARLMYQEVNFLILDEPTNHMDIASREAVEQAVRLFAGTVLVVSHDRYFLDSLVETVVEISGGKLEVHEGNFTEYFKRRYPVLPRLSGEIKTRGKDRASASSGSSDVLGIEQRIEEHERKKTELEHEMEDAFKKNDRKSGLKTAARLEKLSRRLEKLYSEWEVLGG